MTRKEQAERPVAVFRRGGVEYYLVARPGGRGAVVARRAGKYGAHEGCEVLLEGKYEDVERTYEAFASLTYILETRR